MIEKTTPNIKDVSNQITNLLEGLDFKKNRLTWHRVSDELVQVVNLQRSKWGEQYYVNIGLLIRQLDDCTRPRTAACHVIGRLAMFVDSSNPSNFVIDLDESAHANNLESTMSTLQIVRDSFLKKCVSIDGLRRCLRKHRGLLVTADAKDFLRTLN